MEISVGGSKTKSLDLNTILKSEDSNKETSSWGEEAETKKRKNRKEEVISSFEDLNESKKIKHSTDDDTEVADCTARSPGLVKKINGSSDSVPVPKRPRGSIGRSKVVKSQLHKQLSAASDSVEEFVELKDELIDVLQNEVSDPLASFTEQNGKLFDGNLVESVGSKDEAVKLKEAIKEIQENKDATVSSNSTCADLAGKLNGNSKGKVRKNLVKKKVTDSHPAKGEDTDLVLKSSKRNGTNSRKRKTVAKNVDSSIEKIELDPDDDLEQNAARMLSSRFDPNCTGFALKNTTLALSSATGFEKPNLNTEGQLNASDDPADRVLHPGRHQKGKGTCRKRRRFYEIYSDDMDAHWFLNRKIKIFWPLDESWYYGLVNDYDAEKNLHHIKYDDRDEEWISLENERFKLLLLPNEVPHKPDNTPSEDSTPVHIKDEAFMATHMESEPIISWLTHRVKSSSTSTCLKKQKLADSVLLNSSTGKIPIVYVRRRNRRFCESNDNAGFVLKLDTTTTTSVQHKQFEICISLWPMLRYVLGADILWLIRSVLLLQNGTVVKIWPTVFLEALFVDNIVGLRLFFFEGCLKQAVAFVFLVMKMFCEPEKNESINHQIPVTSVRFKLSFSQNFRKHKLFAYYSFSKVRDSDWRYLDSEFKPRCLVSKQLSLSECTYENIKLMEAGTQHAHIPYAGQSQSQTASFEGLRKKSNRSSTIYSLKNGNLPPFALSFTAAPNFFISLHLKLLLERSISLQDHDCIHLENSSESSCKSHEEAIMSSKLAAVDDQISNTTCISAQIVEIGNPDNLKGISVEIPTSDEVYSDGIICSPNPATDPRSWHPNQSGPWAADGKTDFIGNRFGNGFGNGPKKPRTQVQYTLPSRNKGHVQMGLPYQRIRKANDKNTLLDASSKRRSLELVACDANILINGGDKGWRERGARIFLEVADQNEWKLAVKRKGELKYGYKVHQDLQPGSTNRYTHAMMWKGGKDWALEFPDRSQWFLFKEMHEECHNRNIRAASIKNIPIPGVRLIEDLVGGDHEVVPFVRGPWYFRQVRNDVEMAMDGSRVMYDMDSDDEKWVAKQGSKEEEKEEDGVITHEVFEKVMDMLEKVSYAQKCDQFTSGEIEELIARVSPVQVAKSIYEYWREKRQRKGMPLIRHLQPPLWERYQQTCREWDELKPKFTTGSGSHSQSAGDKPPMFAFCLKPRGLELLNKGSKHRPHKKISLSGHSHAFLPDHDPHHSSGRRVNNNNNNAYGYGFGDERGESVSPLLGKMYSPIDAGGPPHFSLDGGDDWNRMQRNNSSKRTVISPKMGPASSVRKAGKRNNNGKKVNPEWQSPHSFRHHQNYNHPGHQILLGGPDLDEFRLRDASSAAKHARNMAKLKRERAQKLMLSADLAIHKAVSALMTAEAIKASYCTARDHAAADDIKSTSPPSSTS